MIDLMTWPAVAAKLIDNLPGIIAAVGACLAYLQTRKNTTMVTTRADSQDHKLDEIHEATNGGVQALRDKVVIANERIDTLEALLKTALAELRVERAKS